MRHALGLLRGSTLPLESVARQCGYDSASHLSRSVKAATGKTIWSEKVRGDFYGSPVCAGDTLWCMSRRGTSFVAGRMNV